MRQRVLVVDDDEAVLRAYVQRLSHAGFEVHKAASEREAVRRMTTRPFDAVVVDVCLTCGGNEGLRLAKQVRRSASPSPFIVLTAYGVPIHADAAAKAGADAFLHKPVSLDWLADLLRLSIEARRGRRTGSLRV